MADEERPFQAEYAKSGRASCKQCKGTISKDSLRLAKMVQSAHFDGRQPNWYHFACFFKTGLIKLTNEVSGYGSLRWEDQERIRKKIPGESVGGGGGGEDATDGPVTSAKGKKGGKGGSKRKTTRSDLKVEYAKSNRSSCKGCNSQIDKDDVRIAKMVQPEAEKVKFGGLIPSWHHVDCFLENLESLDADGVGAEELSGFTKLKKETKDELKGKFIPGVKQAKKGRKREAEEEAPPPVKILKEKNADEKALKEQSTIMWKYRDQMKEDLSKANMEVMLTENGQKMSKGESAIHNQLADGMTIGALPSMDITDGPGPSQSGSVASVGNSKMDFILGRHDLMKPVIIDRIKGMGRKVMNKVTEDVTICIANEGPSKVKMTVKGSAVVDPDSNLDGSHHVLEEGKRVWNVVLGLVDIVRGSNSYYKLQLLESDHSKSYTVFRSWGGFRTGNKVECFGSSKESAKQSFVSLYEKKTENHWEDKTATKENGNFYPLEIDNGQSEEGVSKLGASSGSSSLRMIFDVESTNRAVVATPKISSNKATPAIAVDTSASHLATPISIKKVECTTLVNCTVELETALHSDKAILNFLNREGFIKPNIYNDVNNPKSSLSDDDKAGLLVTGIKKRVELNPKNYHQLMRYFREDSRMYGDIADILDEEYLREEEKTLELSERGHACS